MIHSALAVLVLILVYGAWLMWDSGARGDLPWPAYLVCAVGVGATAVFWEALSEYVLPEDSVDHPLSRRVGNLAVRFFLGGLALLAIYLLLGLF